MPNPAELELASAIAAIYAYLREHDEDPDLEGVFFLAVKRAADPSQVEIQGSHFSLYPDWMLMFDRLQAFLIDSA